MFINQIDILYYIIYFLNMLAGNYNQSRLKVIIINLLS